MISAYGDQANDLLASSDDTVCGDDHSLSGSIETDNPNFNLKASDGDMDEVEIDTDDVSAVASDEDDDDIFGLKPSPYLWLFPSTRLSHIRC